MPATNELHHSAEILESLGAKPSISEEKGLSLIGSDDLVVYSPGISTAGFAEIRMARANTERKIVATTIDEKGLSFAREVINEVCLQDQIETRLEDLRNGGEYPPNFFDFVYARLVLHYLSAQELDKVLGDFYRSIKPDGKLFIVVRSVKNIPKRDDVSFDEETKMTSIPHYNERGEVVFVERRYFHTPESIKKHLTLAGFDIQEMIEYQEQLYKDFMRKEISANIDQVIEVQGHKRSELT